MKVPTNKKVRKYLYKLSKSLKHLPQNERQEILNEIQSHIEESWLSISNGVYNDSSLDQVFEKLGGFEELAKHYCEQRGFLPPKKSHVLRNSLLIILGFFALSALLAGYGIYRISSPIAKIISSDGDLIKIDKEGISALGGKIKIDDDGVKISGAVNIGVGKSHFNHDGKYNQIKGSENIVIPQSVKKIIVKNISGDIKIKGAARNNIKLDTIKFIPKNVSPKTAAILNELKVTSITNGDTLTLEAQYPDERLGIDADYSIDMNIEAPSTLSIQIDTVSGDTQAMNINGSLDFKGVSGDLDIGNIKGATDINSVSGDIKLQNLGASVKINSVSGDVDLHSASNNADINNVSGDITVDNVKGQTKINTTSGTIDLKGLSNDLTAETVSGDINIKVNPSLEFELLAEANIDEVNANFPIRIEDNRIHAKIGSGKNRITIETNSGSVDIKK